MLGDKDDWVVVLLLFVMMMTTTPSASVVSKITRECLVFFSAIAV
jgi:hypothetical protein